MPAFVWWIGKKALPLCPLHYISYMKTYNTHTAHRWKFLLVFLLLPCCCQVARGQEENSTKRIELFCGATLGYADTNWLRLYDVQLNATPGVRWLPGHDWSIAAQGLIPIVSDGYTYRDIVNKYWRLNMITVARQLHFNRANQHLKLTAGLFGYRRYGADVKWAWPVNSWLLLEAQAALTSDWIMGTDFKGNYDADFRGNFNVSGTVGAAVYLHPQNIEFRLSGGRYIYNDYGMQFDVMRHFRHVTLLAFAQLHIGKMEVNEFDKKIYRANGGFKIVWMLPPYKKSSHKVVVRPASNFRLTNLIRSNGQSMRQHTVDPEENERERQVEVDWGLRKEEKP